MPSSLSGRVAIVIGSTRGVCLALTKELDLTSDSSVQKLVSEVTANQRLIDILLNKAGYSFDNQIWLRGFMR